MLYYSYDDENDAYIQDNVDDDANDSNIAHDYCPSLNHNFLDLFESEIQNDFIKDEKVSENDVEEVIYNPEYIMYYKVNINLLLLTVLLLL